MHSNILSCDCSDQVPYSHIHTPDAICRSIFSFSLSKICILFSTFFTWFPFISTPFTRMQIDTCEYSKIFKVQTSTLIHITKMYGWKNGEQILLYIKNLRNLNGSFECMARMTDKNIREVIREREQGEQK